MTNLLLYLIESEIVDTTHIIASRTDDPGIVQKKGVVAASLNMLAAHLSKQTILLRVNAFTLESAMKFHEQLSITSILDE